MISRKGAALAGTALAVVLVTTFSFADDEKSKAHQAMEKVQKEQGIIKKNTKNAAAFKKGQKEVVAAAEALVKLGKDERDDEEPAKKEKKTQEEWAKYMDSFIKESETFAKKAGEANASQAEVKSAYNAVAKTCSTCHDVFHKDE